MARRTFRRPRIRRQQGRQGLWVRQPAYSPTVRQGTIGLYSDLVVEPSDFERERQTGTQTKWGRGGPILERMIIQVGASLTYNEGTSGTVVAPAMEVLVHSQSAEFVNFVATGGSMDDTIENQRVLHYALYEAKFHNLIRPDGARVQLNWFASFQVKTKARLTEAAIGLSLRLNASVVAAGVVDATPLAIATSYLTTP